MWGEPSFDQNQFAGRRTKAVKATKTREGGWDTPGISFADFDSMHVHRRMTQQRRLPAPQWALNDEGTRGVVLRFCEGHVGIRNGSGTDAERMQAIRDKAKAILPNKEAQLEIALRQFHELNGAQPEGTHRDFSIQVQNRDTQVQVLRRGLPELATAVVYLYYRLGWNSVAVAEQLKIKSPAVREWLFRMGKYAKGERSGSGKCRIPLTPWPKDKMQQLFVMRLTGKTFQECSKEFCVSAAAVGLRWRQAFGDLTVKQIKARAVCQRVGRAVKQKKARARSDRLRAWDDDALRRLFILRACGFSFAQCGERFGRHPSGVQWIWKKHFGDLKLSRTAR